MNNFYSCNTLDDIKNWLKNSDAKHGEWLLSEFNRLQYYQNAVEWNQLVLLCEAITMRGWAQTPFDNMTPVEAYCGKGLSGSFETSLMTADWKKQPGSWRDWSKKGDTFVVYKGADTQDYGITKLNCQRNQLPTNPFKMGRFMANCQLSVKPFVAQMEQLRAMLEAQMKPANYGDAFYFTDIRCSFSNHDDEYETVRTEYFHDEKDIPPNCESAYVSVVPHIAFGKLSVKRDRLCWQVEMVFSRAWGEMPLIQQKQAFSEDLNLIFAEFETRIAKKKLAYNAKQSVLDANEIINKWLAA